MPSRNPNSPGHNPYPEIIELLRALPAAIAAEMSRQDYQASAPAFGSRGRPSGGASGASGPSSPEPAATPSARGGVLGAALDFGHALGGKAGKLASDFERAWRIAETFTRLIKAIQGDAGASESEAAAAPAWKAEQIFPLTEADVVRPTAAEIPMAQPSAVVDAEWEPAQARIAAADKGFPQLEYRPSGGGGPPPAGPQIPPGVSPYEAELIRQGQPYRIVGATEPAEKPTLQETLEAEGQPYRVGPAAVPEYGRPVEGASTDIPGAQVVEIPPKEDADFAPPPAEEFRGQGHVNPAWQGEEGAGIEAAAVPEGGVGLAGMEGGAEGGAENKMDGAADKLSDVADKLLDVAGKLSDAGEGLAKGHGEGGGLHGQGGAREEGDADFESADGLGEELTAGGGAEALAGL